MIFLLSHPRVHPAGLTECLWATLCSCTSVCCEQQVICGEDRKQVVLTVHADGVLCSLRHSWGDVLQNGACGQEGGLFGKSSSSAPSRDQLVLMCESPWALAVWLVGWVSPVHREVSSATPSHLMPSRGRARGSPSSTTTCEFGPAGVHEQCLSSALF